jgi:hypothetical protein
MGGGAHRGVIIRIREFVHLLQGRGHMGEICGLGVRGFFLVVVYSVLLLGR